ncbi:DEAD/DEAH box helicase [Candidatus Spongiihabitans sp.]|uniref:DEAD/DEAH box helicase n=1 Tax=Candidatus Spongiihabitans sp. TaxID=3101308 RepID=UPI003C6F41AF
MTTKTLKRYQEKAVDELLLKTRLLLDKSLDKKTIVFQSPTGSGKTLMMTEYIEQLIKEFEDTDLCFLWISIGKGNLHVQSYNSLNQEFQGFPDVYLLEQEFFGSRETITRNEIVVVNWEKLRAKDNKTGEWKNILMKDKETTNFRELIRNTKEDKTTIIMIIDESHSNSTSERALELRDKVVNADLTIEMSATPVLREGEYNEKVVVEPNDVIEEGMIKKEIIINENIGKIDDDETTSQELIMQAAFEKREELRQLYQKMDIDINPLVMVQLPSGEAGEDKKEFVEGFLAEKDINYENKRLAVWLSEEKVNNENMFVTPNDSEVDFLIFKQAIDTGWDCPRASILVRFREIRSIVFEIQTIGRILRMPEAAHYEEDNLNKGFVYTNVKSLEVKKETYNPNIIKPIIVKRKDVYEPLKLKSYYRNRVDFGDITLSFYKVLDKTFCKYFGLKIDEDEILERNRKKVGQKINLENLDNRDEIILDVHLDAKLFDALPEHEISGREADLFSEKTLIAANLSQDDLFHAFESLIRVNLNGFSFKRSVPTVKQALYRWFRKYLDINLVGNGIIYIQNITLNNADIFSQLFDRATREYKPVKDEEINKKIEEIEEWNNAWDIAKSRNLNPHSYKKFDYALSLYTPCYLNIDSGVETDFIKYLENKKAAVKWWWQNGNEHMSLNFGIKYNRKSTFQPDFIVLFENGKLGIFDTKASGNREDDNKLKGEALQKYITEEKKNIFGGLIVKEGQHFRINEKKIYSSFQEKPNDWVYLEELIN